MAIKKYAGGYTSKPMYDPDSLENKPTAAPENPDNPNTAGARAEKNGRVAAGPGTPNTVDSTPTSEPKKEGNGAVAATTSTGQIALLGSSVDPAYEKAKEARRRNRGAQAKALGNF